MQAYASRTGWIMLAAIVMFSVGVFRGIPESPPRRTATRSTTSHLGCSATTCGLWGIWDLIIAVIAIWAGYSLLGGGKSAASSSYVWAVLVIVNSFACSWATRRGTRSR